MPLSIYRKLGIKNVKSTTVSLLFVDKSIKHPRGILDDVLVKVDKFIFHTDFIILDMEDDEQILIIVRHSIFTIRRTLIGV